jgi:molybdopterin/thiamine biosynthesis adenylyltransferase
MSVLSQMDDQMLLRYSRHLLLEPFGLEAQSMLDATTALVIGAGGLGSAALMYLASAGVGRIVIVDGDTVDLTNLQRQVIHDEASIGVNKATSAKKRLQEINSTIQIETATTRCDEAALFNLVRDTDIVLDCTDNFQTRHAINRAAHTYKKILVSGAAIRFDGQVTSFDFRREAAPCYACLFPEDDAADDERCAVMGVLAPLVGVIGAMQAVEAIRCLTSLKNNEAVNIGRLQLFDARSFTWREVRYVKDSHCKVCGDVCGDAHSSSTATTQNLAKELAHA